jgi:hypothetical protein
MDLFIDYLFENSQSLPVPGYAVRSTAPINVETEVSEQRDIAKPRLQQVIDCLYANSNTGAKDPGLVIAIHGYNTGAGIDEGRSVRQGWYTQLGNAVNQDPFTQTRTNNYLFLGYLWPSETISKDNLGNSYKALPFLLGLVWWGGIGLAIAGIILAIVFSAPLAIILTILGVFLFAMVFCLFLLRVIVYFRDSYRASNFGVLDLVELIRQLDQGLMERKMRDGLSYEAALEYWQNNPIKLSFLGHSMGAHVTAEVIRILSDVFDSQSIGKLGRTNVGKLPSAKIGRVFALGRLVLVAPDIPVLAITSGRANFLRSSLRRFEEAYLFSNEGDLALRLASTTANYFSFPAKSRFQGNRLGNVTVKRQVSDRTQKLNNFGIINLEKLATVKIDDLLQYLEIGILNQRQKQSLDPASQRLKKDEESVATDEPDNESIADLFTYFDCTEYQDYTYYRNGNQLHNVLLMDGQKSPLKLPAYLRLFRGFISSGEFPKSRDVHGGYFWGKFSQLLIYRLAFVGFSGLLEAIVLANPADFGIVAPLPEPLHSDLIAVRSNADSQLKTAQLEPNRQVALRYLSWLCQQKHIQVALSSERYQVDVKGRDRGQIRTSVLTQAANLKSSD